MNCQEKIKINDKKLQNIFLKRWFWSKFLFLSIRMQRKKDLVRAVLNRREPQRHLVEKTELEKSWEFLRNFLQKIPEEFTWISRNLFFYLISLKINQICNQVQRISQDFPEKYSGEILRNFLEWNSGEIYRNFSKLIFLIKFP